jgi:hypothetical protein
MSNSPLGVLFLALIICAHAFPAPCHGQEIPKDCADDIQQVVNGPAGHLNARLQTFLDAPQRLDCIWALLVASGNVNTMVANARIRTALQNAYEAQKRSNTMQEGSSAGSGGSTNAISKPNTPLSLATDFGGITSSTNSQTVTFQAPLDGIPRTLVAHGDLAYCTAPLAAVKSRCVHRKVLDALDRVGVGVSVNTSATSKNVTGTATGAPQGTTQQAALSSVGSKLPSLASVFTKVTVFKGALNLPDPKKIDATPEQKDFVKVWNDLLKIPAYSEWQNCMLRRLNKPSISLAELQDAFAKYYVQIVGVMLAGTTVDCSDAPASRIPAVYTQSPTKEKQQLLDDLEDYLAAAGLVEAQFYEAATAAADAPMLSVEYDYNTPQNQPSNSTIKLVGSFSFLKSKAQAAAKSKADAAKKSKAAGTGKTKTGDSSDSSVPTAPLTLTYNSGISLYNYTPASTIPGSGLLRDVQVGTQLDYNISSSNWPGVLKKIGDNTASATYYFQYQTSPSILNVTPGSPLNGITITGLPSTATQVFAKKGDIHVAQLKWGLGKGKNVKFPIAVTYSNRTELITHPTWGIQFGVSYDLSSFMGTGSSK